jgi:hypothetical protein
MEYRLGIYKEIDQMTKLQDQNSLIKCLYI